MGQCTHHWVRREAAECAERPELHRVAEIFKHSEICRALGVADDAIDDFDTANGADPTGRTLPAGFDRAELHREARLLRHINCIVEYDDTPVANEAIAGSESLIVERS